MNNTTNNEGVNMIKVAKDKLVNILSQFGTVVNIDNDTIEFTREDKFALISLTFLQDIWKENNMILNVNVHSIRHTEEGFLSDGKYISYQITDTGLLNIAKDIITVFDNCNYLIGLPEVTQEIIAAAKAVNE